MLRIATGESVHEAARGGRFAAFLCSLILLLAAASCSDPASKPTVQGSVADRAGLIEYLRGKGFTVEIVGDVEQPFLRAQGKVLHVRAANAQQPEEMQTYEYDDEAAAKSDAGRIAPDGSVQGAKILWIAPPRFFQRGRLFVIYLGSNPEVARALTDSLGPQFAGQN